MTGTKNDIARILATAGDPLTAGDQPENAVAPDLSELLLDTPLYSPVEATDRDFLSTFRGRNFQIDAHCLMCGKESVFKTSRSYGAGSGTARDYNWMHNPGHIVTEIVCQRDDAHRYVFDFYYDGKSLFKYGQLPSLEDISSSDIEPYRKVLSNESFAELKRAGGLASHGIGIGSFVYLRRIFERLVADHHDIFVEANGPIERYNAMRMDEKIGALKSVLPKVLVENKATYAILSKGVHELDEDTCRKYFPVVRKAIISILEQDLANKRAEQEAEDLRKEIAAIAGELKSK